MPVEECVDCVRDPSENPISPSLPSSGKFDKMKRCQGEYVIVAACMKKNRDQVSSCVDEWKAFRICHNGPEQSSQAKKA